MSPLTSSSSQSGPAIVGYTLTEQLYRGSKTAVYRGIQNADQRSVVVKVLLSDYPTFSELVQFRNQYEIAKNLNLPGIIHPLSLQTLGNGYALVMEDWGGLSLSQYLQQHTLNWVEVLKIALQLATILHDLHQQRVIHKDIKPANILINPESKEVKLIDFSIASLLPKENQEIQNPNILEGTLTYLAPEQTGRMNRGIDYRADYYALGVTLYQLLTGQLPFESDDPLELLHCHIAKTAQPVDQVNMSVPKIIGAIVAKLMAKNAEDRYQSALGLQHDLQQCLSQWEATDTITEFELGQRDLSDRFLIPEKLYGRETEVQILLSSFERVSQGASELMLVAGFSGIGKTAVVNEVHKPITQRKGYFLKGKFDQFNRNIPFSAFVQAFRSLMAQLLSESDSQLQLWKHKILTALGDSGQVIVEVIPELERIIGQQPATTELSGIAAQNRFNLLFQRFIRVFTTPEHPLVIFLDDLQWADLASLQLIKLLMNDNGYLLMLGAYRDNEVFAAHSLMSTLNTIRKAGITVNTIKLEPLNQISLNQLVTDTLHCVDSLAQPLTELVMQKTQGNPFFAAQFLRALYQEKMITFDADVGCWQCDIVLMRDAALTDDVVEFIALQLQKLPTAIQNILKLAACIGAEFDLQTLAIVSEQSQTEVATSLWTMLQEGLVIPQGEVCKFYLSDTEIDHANPSQTLNYKFLHDRVQQAAYSLIPPEQIQSIHYHIGSLLLKSLSPVEKDLRIFELVGQLNYGKTLVIQPTKRKELAELNLAAGQKAIASTAYQAAIEYLEIGISWLGEQMWVDDYNLIFSLYRSLASAYLSNNNYENLSSIITIALDHIFTPIDRAEFYLFEIIKYTLQGDFEQAIKTGLHGLSDLEIEIIQNENTIKLIRQELADTANALGDRPIISLLNLPSMNNVRIQTAMKLLMALDAPAYISANFELYELIALRAVRFSMEYGNLAESIKAYANYGLILSLTEGQYQQGYEFADLAMQLSYKLNSPSQRCKATFLLGFWIQAWAKPLIGAANLNYEGFLAGMVAGENQFAAYNLFGEVYNQLFQGENLAIILEKIETYELVAKHTQDELLRVALAGARSFIMHLGVKQNTQTLDQEILEVEKIVQDGAASQAWLSVCLSYVLKIHLCCLKGDFQQGYDQLVETEKRMSAIGGATTSSGYYYYGSLILLNLYLNLSKKNKRNASDQIQSNQSRLRNWSNSCPENFLHKYLLVEAERYRVFGKRYEAADYYDRAIAEAKANEYIQEEGLANELAAKFYLSWDKDKVAAGYMQEAYYCYAKWGAKAKTDDLETCYPHLLRPILQAATQPFNILESFATIAAPNLSLHSSTAPNFSSSSSVNAVLDFATILRASQNLAGTIQIDELLHQLTQIILQNSGGDRCALTLPNSSGEWSVVAIATLETTELYADSLKNNTTVPIQLIQYVKNIQETVVINDGKTDLPVLDEYLSQQRPKSVLCLPILNQAKLMGILYLENRSTSQVFTSDRLLILNFLCTQAAISLENARLYSQVQQTLTDLQNAQLQMVQSEKMASLGNLVAGVAHEINNPIGFLNGSINNGKEHVQDLLEHLALYQQHYPSPTSPIQDHAEDIDLEYVCEDLPQLLNSMQGATDRIKSISTSLRTFSRADTEYKVSANLHEGIDSTLLILKYRLKANANRPAIEVITNYGEIPPIDCFPGQLNQVFMNILANAIDMFDELAQGRSFKELEANPQQITISTTLVDDRVQITIQDNGKGMSAEVQSRIFDHLFTTKSVGKGTGLGLAIAQQIVVDKHSGSLTVESEPGQGAEFRIQLPIEG
ncbi:MAG: trifunctional serine/threonine-protein kinase/ATP-binding protein/sensor histidine kinase [Limnothrix sp. BL-A-16]